MTDKEQMVLAIVKVTAEAPHLSETQKYVLLQEKSEAAIPARVCNLLEDAIGYDEQDWDSFEDETDDEDLQESDDEIDDEDLQESEEAPQGTPISEYWCRKHIRMYTYEAQVVAAVRVPQDLSKLPAMLDEEFEEYLSEEPEIKKQIKKIIKQPRPDIEELTAVLEELCEAAGVDGDPQLFI